jgi:GNAT superfamily N-acetyltransferase
MQSSTRIRRARPADAAAIAEVLKQAFAEFEAWYTPQGFAATTPDGHQIARRLEEGPGWVALCDEQIVGTASAILDSDQGLYVRGVAVTPSLRGKGLARLLMNEVEGFAKQNACSRMFLTTTPFLDSAIRLYERLGFIRDGADDLFGTPLIRMEKRLT